VASVAEATIALLQTVPGLEGEAAAQVKTTAQTFLAEEQERAANPPPSEAAVPEEPAPAEEPAAALEPQATAPEPPAAAEDGSAVTATEPPVEPAAT
jgi:hypothetical protein